MHIFLIKSKINFFLLKLKFVVYVFGGNLWSAAQLRVVFEIYNIYILLIKKKKIIILNLFLWSAREVVPTTKHQKWGGGVLSNE